MCVSKPCAFFFCLFGVFSALLFAETSEAVVLVPVVSGPESSADGRPTWTWTSITGDPGFYRYQLDAEEPSGWEETMFTEYTPSSPLSDGSHTLHVQQWLDATSDWSASGSWTVTVDTPPNAPFLIPLPTAGHYPTWIWASNGGGNGTFRHSFDETNWTETTMYAYTPVDPLPDGTYTFYVQERDDTGNWSASASTTTVVDGPPLAPVVTGPEAIRDLQPTWTWTSGGAWQRYVPLPTGRRSGRIVDRNHRYLLHACNPFGRRFVHALCPGNGR